ncbi:GerAB/ArcD/ProY family transporter [Alkalihalobacterium alkalinitrilicum]|uniref:GerAB/ArcD/ProY family transporter n=1 Tax=Alkalihalobacterium alkalinitrilicum TaxID=427920 RepID=UPI001152AE61|nr:GerAB/ArcD/ProY family transporter [Alkalihalobacterium alkalinitrilicum]
MSVFSLYDQKESPFGGIYVIFLVNRLQMIYFFLIMPTYLVYPYMVWGILALGIVSHLNLLILSKWFSSDFAKKGYLGFVQLFGQGMVRIFACVGVFLILIKISVIMLGYVEVYHQFIFSSVNPNWLILFVFIVIFYITYQGMENTIRFVVIVFFFTFWAIGLFVPFLFPPIAALHDLYPLIPVEWSRDSWKGLLLIWSALSGPEYLILLATWLKPNNKMKRNLAIGNAVTVFEYLFLFIASLFYYSSNFLSLSKFPVPNMLQYLESPVFERVDILLLTLHWLLVIFVIAIFMLVIFRAKGIIMGKWGKNPTLFGLVLSFIVVMVFIVIMNEWFWKSEQNLLLELQIWLGALTYTVVPFLLYVAVRLKERVNK